MKVLIINLAAATERLAFQEQQMVRLNLPYQVMQAIHTEQIKPQTYQALAHGWERPLRVTELACFLSHHNAWQAVQKAQEPMLIIEDDALLAKQTPQLLSALATQKDCDLVTLEVRSRKKLLGKQPINWPDFSLWPLYQERTGAAAYVLWPSGAAILLDKVQNAPPALADAFISSTYKLRSFQVEPAAAIQLGQCTAYGIKPELLTDSFIDAELKPRPRREHLSNRLLEQIAYRSRRLYAQLRLVGRKLSLLGRSEQREIVLNKGDFNQ